MKLHNNMSYKVITFGNLAVILGYICYVISIKDQVNSLNQLPEIFINDEIFKIICLGSIGLIGLYFLLNLLYCLIDHNKYYAQRISIREYEIQKQTYTQLKIYELIKSKEYQDYIRNKK